MTAPGATDPGRRFHGRPAAALPLQGLHGALGSGFADGVCERQEIVRVVLRWRIRQREADHFPAARYGQPPGVQCTQVIGVRFGVGGEGSEDGGGICVDVRQCGNCRPLAG